MYPTYKPGMHPEAPLAPLKRGKRTQILLKKGNLGEALTLDTSQKSFKTSSKTVGFPFGTPSISTELFSPPRLELKQHISDA